MKRFALPLFALLISCEPTPWVDTALPDETATPPEPPSCEPDGAHRCQGAVYNECQSGDWVQLTDCGDSTGVCAPGFGCVTCFPQSKECEGNTIMECASNGSALTPVQTCEPPFTCNQGECIDPCDPSHLSYSYLGCDFLAVSTLNALLSPTFNEDFAVVIGAPAGGYDAQVVISRGGAQVNATTIPAGTTAAISLAMVQELRTATGSSVVIHGAYEVHSSVPVVAYQYNPLNFTLGAEASYTNDASLLVPEHVLGDGYRVSTFPTWGYADFSWSPFGGGGGDWSWQPGFTAIAATTDGTQVSFTSAGITQGGTIAALQPGQISTVQLNRGDVLQFLSHVPGPSSDLNLCTQNGWESAQSGSCPATLFDSCNAYCSATTADLTGSLIQASQKVAVFAGHSCTNQPFNSVACDHLEESMLPIATWGREVVMSAPVHPSGAGKAQTVYRVLADKDGTSLTFEPPVHAPATLNAGQFLQFTASDDFLLTGSQPVFVTQGLLGQSALGGQMGDPAMGSGIPFRQYRSDYDLLTPSTFTANYLNVVASPTAAISLDGAQVTGFEPIPNTPFAVARVPVLAGSHHIESSGGERFGITTYGYASFTSYLYPGGMNLKR